MKRKESNKPKATVNFDIPTPNVYTMYGYGTIDTKIYRDLLDYI